MQFILIFCSLIGLLFGAYFAWTCLGGLFRKSTDAPASSQASRRIAAVIAARNEEAVIGDLIHSLTKQQYPRELFDIYVIPNNCTDRTEKIAREAGAAILSCPLPVHTKGDALKYAFDHLTAMQPGYDAYCIFDADNLVDSMFFQAVSDARAQGFHAAQGYRDSRNPHQNWISGCMSVFYWFMSRFYNAGRSALGMSCALNGTGFMVSDELIRRMGWNTQTLTEDLEFSAQCALNGVKIGWMPRARVYDEQPAAFRDSFAQRRRWSSGSLQCLRRYALPLYARRTVHSADMALLFTSMLLNPLGILSFLLTAGMAARQITAVPESLGPLLLSFAGSAVICWLLMSAGCALMFRLEGRLTLRCLPAIAMFAPFMLSWMFINLSCFFSRPPKWVAIRHSGGRSVSG